MKKAFLFLVVAIATLSVSAQRYSDSTWIIGVGHVGKVVINMDEQKLASIFPGSQIKTDKKSEEGNEYSIINVTVTGDTKVSLEMETMCMDICLISRIDVYSDKFKTIKGIGVGSLVGDLKKNYNVTSVIGGEKGIMIYTEELPQTAFVVDVPGLKSTPGKTILATSVPDNTKIEWVYMY
jgi:hypothetical protein